MKADRPAKHLDLPPPTRIRFSRPVTAFATLALILLAIAPAQLLAARNWEPGADIQLNVNRKHIQLTTDPKALVVELPAGQSVINKRFELELPDEQALEPLRAEIEMYKEMPEIYNWAQDLSKIPMVFDTTLHVSAEGNDRLFEVLIVLIDPTPMVELEDDDNGSWKMYKRVAPETYRDVSFTAADGSFTNVISNDTIQPVKYSLLLNERNEGTNVLFPAALEVRLREIPLVCTMNVSYWGDVEGFDSGDLAYYNNFLKEGGQYKDQGGVARATGSGADPTALAALNQLMGFAVTLDQKQNALSAQESAAMSGSAFDPFSGATYPELEELAESAAQEDAQQKMAEFDYWVGGKGQVPDPELETFGLTLAGRNVSQTGDRKADLNEGVTQLMNSSVLLAASRATFMGNMPENSNMGQWSSNIPLSRLEFRPMAMGALFRWNEGEPGFGELQVNVLTAGAISGEINGTLYSREMRRDDGSDSEINVHASFIAAEGAFGCDLPGVGKVLK